MDHQSSQSCVENTADYWGVQIERWESSGLTQAVFCKENNFHHGRFCYWRKKLCKKQSPKRSGRLLPIGIKQNTSASPAVYFRLRFATGTTLDVPVGLTKSQLGQLFEVVGII